MTIKLEDRKMAVPISLSMVEVAEIKTAAHLNQMDRSTFIRFLVNRYLESAEYQRLLQAYRDGGGLQNAR